MLFPSSLCIEFFHETWLTNSAESANTPGVRHSEGGIWRFQRVWAYNTSVFLAGHDSIGFMILISETSPQKDTPIVQKKSSTKYKIK